MPSPSLSPSSFSFLPLSTSVFVHLSSTSFTFLLILRSHTGKGRGKRGGGYFVVAHTDLPRARALIGLPRYFTTDSGLKGLNAVVRMGSR